MKISGVFLSENFQFLEVKFSIYLNRRVFVMNFQTEKGVNSESTRVTITLLGNAMLSFFFLCLSSKKKSLLKGEFAHPWEKF